MLKKLGAVTTAVEWFKFERRKEIHSKPVQTKAIEPSDNAYLWFAKRGIPRDIINRNKKFENMLFTSNKQERCIVSTLNETLVNIKYRSSQKHFQYLKKMKKKNLKI